MAIDTCTFSRCSTDLRAFLKAGSLRFLLLACAFALRPNETYGMRDD